MATLTCILLLFLFTTLHLTTAQFIPYGFQSGHFTNPTDTSTSDAESINDDSFAGGMHYDAQRNLLYFTGITYGRYFDGSEEGSGDGGGSSSPHLANSDCILGVLKLPRDEGPNLRAEPNWLIHNGGSGVGGAKLIYARRYVILHCQILDLVLIVSLNMHILLAKQTGYAAKLRSMLTHPHDQSSGRQPH
jgi:hypothetical protein